MKSKLTKLLILLAAATTLASIALTFAQPYHAVTKETNAEYHEECKELREQMHKECTEMMNHMHHGNHDSRMQNETMESHGHQGCH
jgi:hypothetical protein